MQKISILLAFVFFSCQKNQESPQPQAVFPEYAKGFSWIEEEGFTILRLHNGADTALFALCPPQAKPQGRWASLPSIEVPVSKAVVLSATHVGMAEALGKGDCIVGLSYPEYLYSPYLHQRFSEGKAINVGMEGGLNAEAVVALMPQVLMASAMPNAQQNKALTAAGIPVMLNGEWMEGSLLARAEWIKVFGLLLGEKMKADSLFSFTKKEYLRLVQLARQSTAKKPTVISGSPYKGLWSAAGGNSYVSRLLVDAGAHWHWASDSSAVSLQLDFEAVYPIALQADYWLWPGTASSLKELAAADKRFEDFPALKQGKVYNYNRRSRGWGNDYWESGVVNPHLILADLIKIMHPELLPEHELYYHQLLP